MHKVDPDKLRKLQVWLNGNKHQLKEYQQLLEIKYNLLIDIIVNSNDESGEIFKGQARQLRELIDELN